MLAPRIVCVLFLLYYGVFAFTQEADLPTVKGKIPLKQFLNKVEAEFNLIFNYNAKLVDTCIIPNVTLPNDLSNILAFLRKSTAFDYIDRNPHIIIRNKSESSNNKKLILAGQIIDSTSGDPLPYSSLILKHTHRGSEADDQGYFRLQFSPEDLDQVVEINHLGYKPYSVPVSTLLNYNISKIKLSPMDLPIRSILVKDQAILPVDFKPEKGYYDIRSDQLQLQAGWGEADVLRMLQIVPGIQATDESSANLHIRGGTPDQNLLLLDDIPIYKAGHFFGFFSTINTNLIEQVKVYKGGFGAGYGGRSSGVIDIKNKLSDVTRFQGSVGLTPLNFHVDLAMPLFKKKSSLLVGSRSSIIGEQPPPLFRSTLNQKFQSGKIAEYRDLEDSDILNRNEAVYDYGDFNVRWQYRFKKDDAITLSHFSNQDDFQYDFEIDQPTFTQITNDKIRSSNRGSSIKISNRWTPKWQSTLNIIDSKFDNFFTTRYSGDAQVSYQAKAFQNNTLKHNRLSLNQLINFSSQHTLDLGLEANQWDISFETAYERVWVPETDTLHLKLSNLVSTAYFDYNYNHQDALFLQLGLRRNKLQGAKIIKYEPRFAIKYKVPDSPWLMKASVGTYQQFISQIVLDRNDDNLGTANGIWLTTELNVVPIVQSKDLSFGFTFQDQGWTFDLEAYRKHTDGLSALNLRIDRGEQEVSPGESKATGLELIIQKKFNQYRSLFTYNLASVEYQFPDFNDRVFFPAPHDRRHYLQWNHMYGLGPFDFVLSWHFGSGLPYSIPTNILQIQGDEDEIFHELLFTKRNTERLPAYHRMDLSINYEWVGKRIKIKTGGSLFNLYGRKNIIDRRYRVWYPSEDRAKPELTFLDRRGLRLTPSLYASLVF